MPSDVFWTGLFTFGGGLVGGGAGYLTARLQQAVQKQELGLEERRYETDQQDRRQARRDDLRERRRVLYLKYLGSFDALHTQLNGPELSPEELFEIWSSMIQVDNEIELLGSEAVKSAADNAADYFARLVGELYKIASNPARDWGAEAHELRRPDAMGQEMIEVREELLAKMRVDLKDE
jgi:hypothetical protein